MVRCCEPRYFLMLLAKAELANWRTMVLWYYEYHEYGYEEYCLFARIFFYYLVVDQAIGIELVRYQLDRNNK